MPKFLLYLHVVRKSTRISKKKNEYNMKKDTDNSKEK